MWLFQRRCELTQVERKPWRCRRPRLAEALSALTSQYGELKKHLFAEDGRLRSFVNVYVNDEDIRYLQKDQTSLREGDTVSIVPSIAGGARN